MRTRTGIALAGNWIIDHVKIIDRWPAELTLANILSESIGTGGAPYNVAVDLHKLDPHVPLEAIGLVGRDVDGEMIFRDMVNINCITRLLHRIDDAPTSFTDVMTVQSTGARTFFHNRGANAYLGYEHFDFDAIDARLLHLGYLLLLDSLDVEDSEYGTVGARLLHDLRAHGIRTSVDVVSEDSGRFERVVRPALPHVDFLILNEFEACRTTGHQPRRGDELDFEAVRASARALLEMGVHERVVIHMPEGGYSTDHSGKEVFQPSLRLPPDFVKGTAGAGDAFCAGILYSLYRKWPIEAGLRLAVCVGAMCLTDATCTAGIRPLKETFGLVHRFPFLPNLLKERAARVVRPKGGADAADEADEVDRVDRPDRSG
jgi:sugar/nucleoside kinase (ribokinase family)